MEFYASSASRIIGPEGREVIVASSAAILTQRNGKTRTYKRAHYSNTNPAPTDLGAAILAIVLALDRARERACQLDNNPRMEIIIYSDNIEAVSAVQVLVGHHKGQYPLTDVDLNGFLERARAERAAALDLELTSRRAEVRYIFVDADTPNHPAVEIAKHAAEEHLMGVA
jgi:hypothetical protein